MVPKSAQKIQPRFFVSNFRVAGKKLETLEKGLHTLIKPDLTIHKVLTVERLLLYCTSLNNS